MESIRVNFHVKKVTKRIYRISMPYVCCYLIIGEDKAVLLDAGWGYGDLKAVVESITDLPVTLVLSHGHPDHLGGAVQFDEAYLNEQDFEMSISQGQTELRRKLMLVRAGDGFIENPDLWIDPRTEPYLPLTEDMTFDLGGLTILPFNLPGHSAGSMVFILPEERMAIFGDAVSHPTLMVFDNSSPMQDHYDAMVALSGYSHLYDRVLVNHETYELDKVVLDNNIQLAKAILEGTDDKIPASRRAQSLSRNATIYSARMRKSWLPNDPKDIGNIYYRDDKI